MAQQGPWTFNQALTGICKPEVGTTVCNPSMLAINADEEKCGVMRAARLRTMLKAHISGLST